MNILLSLSSSQNLIELEIKESKDEASMQPVILVDGIARFQKNDIIDWLFNEGRLNLNEIAAIQFSDEDRMQLAQLLGYSVSGFGDLPFATAKVVNKANKKVQRIIEELN